MWMTPHTTVGITIVTKIPNPVISLPLAFLSHYLLDFLPHWTQNPVFKGKESIPLYGDFLLSLGIGLFFAFQHPFGSWQFFLIIAGAALANLPDAIRTPFYIKKRSKEELKEEVLKHPWYHHAMFDQDLKPGGKSIYPFLQGKVWFGIMTQVVVVVVCLGILFIT